MPAGTFASTYARIAGLDVEWSLICDEPKRHLGVRVGRHDGLVARTHVATPDSVNLTRRPRPDALERAVAGFAECGATLSGLEPLRIVERQSRNQVSLDIGQRCNVVVETVECDPVVSIVKTREQVRHHGQGVRHRPAERARMQIDVRPVQVNLAIGQTAHAHTGGDHAGGIQAVVADDDDVAAQGDRASREAARGTRATRTPPRPR